MDMHCFVLVISLMNVVSKAQNFSLGEFLKKIFYPAIPKCFLVGNSAGRLTGI